MFALISMSQAFCPYKPEKRLPNFSLGLWCPPTSEIGYPYPVQVDKIGQGVLFIGEHDSPCTAVFMPVGSAPSKMAPAIPLSSHLHLVLRSPQQGQERISFAAWVHVSYAYARAPSVWRVPSTLPPIQSFSMLHPAISLVRPTHFEHRTHLP